MTAPADILTTIIRGWQQPLPYLRVRRTDGAKRQYRDTTPFFSAGAVLCVRADGKLRRHCQKGESGFYRTDIQGGKPSETNALVNEMNEKLGLSKGQAEAMKAGSMFGWDTPAADPKSYDKNGIPVKPKQKDYER